jgi:hypothetical protein
MASGPPPTIGMMDTRENWRQVQDLSSSTDSTHAPTPPPTNFTVGDVTYTRLDERDNQIRLINILPQDGDSSLVRCTLETVSLKSHSAEYHSFISTYTSTGRKRVIDWANFHPSPSNDSHTPTPSSHRFTWGDYAALSYVWGDPTHTSAIINSHVIQVGAQTFST